MTGRIIRRILFAVTIVAAFSAGVSILFSQARQGQPTPRSVPRLSGREAGLLGILVESSTTRRSRYGYRLHEIEDGAVRARRGSLVL